MVLPFRLLIRRYPDDTWSAHTVSWPRIEAFGATEDGVRGEILGDLQNRLQWSGGNFATRYAFAAAQGFHPLTVVVPVKGDTLEVSIPLVLTPFPGSPDRLLVTSPLVKGFEAVVAGDLDAEEEVPESIIRLITMSLAPELGERLAGWKVTRLLALGRAVEQRLVMVRVGDNGAGASGDDDSNSTSDGESGGGGEGDVLALCGTCLSTSRAEAHLGYADRREALLDRLITTLSVNGSNSVILVGRPDVGKTALIHELARRLAQEVAEEAEGASPTDPLAGLRGRELWSVTASNLIAGMKYYGEWQGRANNLVRQVRQGRQLLYMADPHDILSAGRVEDSDHNLGRYLRPYLESGDVTLICECSPEAYAADLLKEPGFIQSFRRIDVEPLDEAETQAILHSAARRAEASAPVRVEAETLTTILALTRRFLPYREFPGKAVSLLRDVIHESTLRQAEEQPEGKPLTLGRAAAVAAFVRSTGLPEAILSDDAPLSVSTVREYFEERLLGQDEAVEAMTDLVAVLKAGLNDPGKPLGSFFFVGPTGVGKTEMAKVLAEFLFGARDRMLRFDMSEYASRDALPRLIGSAWGTEEGELTRRVRAQPFCVVLLDEFEKAHPEVFDALLGVLGEGRLTDARGRTTDFRNAIVIMTSNLSAGRRELQSPGFTGAGEQRSDKLTEQLTRGAESFFRPEFFNRIDRIVAFRPLTPEAMRRIARRELGRLLMREGIVRRNLLVEIDEAAIAHLVTQGFHPLYGARPLQREIERAVIVPLARLLLDQEARGRQPGQGKLLRFTVREGRIHLSLIPLETPDESERDLERAQASAERADRRLETDLASVTRVLQQVQALYRQGESDPLVQALRSEADLLLARTREPSFWDEGAEAREVLRRVYHLERVLRRREGLAERSDRLEEWAAQLRRQRDRRRLPELAAAVEKLRAEHAYLEVELAGTASAAGQGDQVVLQVHPLSAEAAAWSDELFRMYETWARRKGYEARVSPGNPTDGEPAVLYVRGANVPSLLRGEAGLHKLDAGSAADRSRLLARVAVYPLDDPVGDPEAEAVMLTPAELRELRARAGGSTSPDEVARVYHRGRHRFIRDPRTGTRIGHVEAVLQEGEIDPFLLAYLRLQAQRDDA